MNEARDQDREVKQYVCVCGKAFPMPAGATAGQALSCPYCGTPIPRSIDDPSLAETQMINVREMARIAQEGLDKEVSGDSQPLGPRGRKNGSDREP